ncbi:hypothetical protein FE783_27000 [Paenibacillus mesophilus]|uniref:helicase-associated domain-containing protein n=1 Tax=Paenibacillus mesophilus TaxID=2582849 RepID=UPI00110ECFAD|nr:helicase-associated domain-containing protein [Paenibacillus mesophilus]TMV46074.1 hypothetical protein FE783_27000 [Paenibacillus mesophilus]
MKLEELLANMSEPMRHEICRHNGWAGAEPDLARQLRSDEAVRLMVDSLFELERKTLDLIVRRFGREPFDFAKLEKTGRKNWSGAALKVGLIRLCRRGIIFELRRKWGETDYILPEDCFPLWQKLLLPIAADKAIYEGEEAASDSLYRPGIAVHMLSVLAYIAKEDVTVTQKGGTHKRHAGRLAALVPVRDEELKPAEGAPAIVKADFGSAAVDFLCGAALRLGLLAKGSERLTVKPGRLAQWFSLSEAEMNDRLYELWKTANGSTDVWLQHAVCFAEQMPEGSWISIGSMVGQLCDAGVGTADAKSGGQIRMTNQAEPLLSWLAPLAAWGWSEIGSAADGNRLFRWLRKPQPLGADKGLPHDGFDGEQTAPVNRTDGGGRFFIQPDFELIVPPDCSYRVRWELEMICERVRHEHMAVYRMTRETVVRALDHGRTADGTLQFLEAHAKYAVPDNVKAAIAQWGEQQSQLRVETVTVLRFRDEATADTVRRNDRIAPLLAEALGPAAWVVRADKAAELRALLERSGYSPGGIKRGADEEGASFPLLDEAAQQPEPPVEAGGLDPIPADGGVPSKGLIYSKAAVQYYDRECNFPLIEDVYPGLQEVPPIWLKDLRTYHVSTRKQMVQKALDWKACLRLRKAGADTLLIPLRLDGIRDDWAVTGFEQMNEVRLQPDQWEEMQLILPGINDESR